MNWESCKKVEEITCDENLLIVYGTKETSKNYDFESILTQDELISAAHLRNVDQQNTWLACRATLRLILGRYLCLPPHFIVFQKGHFGKLYVSDCKLFFSISHTNESFLLTISILGRVGIDIEVLEGNEDLPSLIDYAFSEDEISYCKKGNIQKLFTEVWTLKEAFLKAVGVGLISKLTSITVLGTSKNNINQLCLNKKTFLCPQGETASIVYRINQKLKFIDLSLH